MKLALIYLLSLLVVLAARRVTSSPAGATTARQQRGRGIRVLQEFDRDDEIDDKTTPPTPTILLDATPKPTISNADASPTNDETNAPTPPWYIRDTNSPSPKPASPTATPTATDEFPVELRTNPPTPTMLLVNKPSETPTRSPFHEYPTFYPTQEPTCANTTSRAGKIKCAALYKMAEVQDEWSTPDTIILSVALTVGFCSCFLYCLCCRQGKDVIPVDSTRLHGNSKGEYTMIGMHEQALTPEHSPPSSPRLAQHQHQHQHQHQSQQQQQQQQQQQYSRYGGVEVINPLSETSPLLSPPRNRKAAREMVTSPAIPVRVPSKILGEVSGKGSSIMGTGDSGAAPTAAAAAVVAASPSPSLSVASASAASTPSAGGGAAAAGSAATGGATGNSEPALAEEEDFAGIL